MHTMSTEVKAKTQRPVCFLLGMLDGLVPRYDLLDKEGPFQKNMLPS
jgi:hypothetical protein